MEGSQRTQGPMLHEFKCLDSLFWACTRAGLTVYAYVYITLSIYKTLHLAQRTLARFMRFLALPDSNTYARVTINVFGRVVLSQTCMPQVPY